MPKSSTKRKSTARSDPLKKTKDPKASHLYTDDNPSTTIHGTGFKDRAAANKTLDLIKDRSLTYQFQTVNAMYYRAKHHPAMKGGKTANNADMREAMDVFREWLDVTYPDTKAALRFDGFRPLLSKRCVEKYRSKIEAADPDAHAFAEVYVNTGKNKRLGNVLVDESKPMEADWERRRYDQLCALVPRDKEETADWTTDELWEDGKAGGTPSKLHFRLIGWAWSPIGERKLP